MIQHGDDDGGVDARVYVLMADRAGHGAFGRVFRHECAAAAAEAVCGIPALQTLTGGAGEGRFTRLGVAVGNGGDIAPALRRFDRLPRQKYGTVVEAKGKMDGDVREIGTPRQAQGIRGAQHALWAVDEQQVRGAAPRGRDSRRFRHSTHRQRAQRRARHSSSLAPDCPPPRRARDRRCCAPQGGG